MEDVAGRVLIDHALEAAKNAHAPYSKFGVGAALLLEDGTIIPGTNFENASYGLSLCAETVALAAANAAGRLRDVVAIGIVGGAIGKSGLEGDAPIYPCGRCRQVLNEFARGIPSAVTANSSTRPSALTDQELKERMSGQVYSMDDDGDTINEPEIDNFAEGLEEDDSKENP